jgi:hypothetical protein
MMKIDVFEWLVIVVRSLVFDHRSMPRSAALYGANA